VQGRRVELAYTQYFDEDIGRLKQTVVAVDNFLPTDAVMNFGAVFSNEPRNTNCGNKWSDGSKSVSRCPYMKGVCNHFNATHPYNLFWQSTTPRLDSKQAHSLDLSMGTGHNLNPISACSLPAERVLDTYAILRKVARREKGIADLYTAKNSLLPEAYHAFNWNLVRRLSELEAVEPVANGNSWTPGKRFAVHR
jgi:hypothetical protein